MTHTTHTATKATTEARPATQNTAASPRPHSLWVSGREDITVRGVTEVLSFNESVVELITTRGYLTLEGQGLRVTALDTEGGLVSVNGLLYGALYSDEEQARPDDGTDGRGHSRGRRLRLFR